MAMPSRLQPAGAASSLNSTVTETPSHAIPAGKTPSYNSKRLRHIVRDRLLDTIRKTIGREIVQRYENIRVDPKKNDEEPPNFYKWQFSSDYPQFPDGGVTRWSLKDHEACIKALDRGWLSVLALPTLLDESASHKSSETGFNVSSIPRPSENPSAWSIGDIPSNGPPQYIAGRAPKDDQVLDDTSRVLGAIGCGDIVELVCSLSAEAENIDGYSNLQESCENVEHLISHRMATLQGVRELLGNQSRSLSDLKDNMINNTKTKVVNLETTIKDQNAQYQNLEIRYEALQREFISAIEEIKDLEHKLDNPIDEVADLRMAIQDLRKQRDSQEEQHLAQLKRVREETMQKALRQSEASVTNKSGDASIVVDLNRRLKDVQSGNLLAVDEAKRQVTNLQRQIEAMRVKHLIEVARAREEGRREDEELAQLLDVQNVNYSTRKRRELRSIYHNWKNVPQNILSKSMMPGGVTPSDRTLLLLARLSRIEEDPRKATALLEKEIAHRNAQSPAVRRDLALTSADIERVLASFGDKSSGHFTTDMSSIPQPVSSSAERITHDLGRPDLNTCQDRNAIRRSEVVSQSPSFERQSSSGASEYVESNELISRHQTKTGALRGSRRYAIDQVSVRQNHILGKKEREPPTQLKRASRRSAPNLEKQPFASPTKASDLSTLPAGANEIRNGDYLKPATLTIHEEIGLLPVPPEALLPSSPQSFPMDFVKENIRGDSTAFSKCGRTMFDKQLVNWPEMIKINEEIHPLCPFMGGNGALTFVEGRPNIGDVGKTYPTLLREQVGFYQYIGHYKVVKRITMPVETWKRCARDERVAVVSELESKWGETVLMSKGLFINATDNEEKRIRDVLEFFERPVEPCLRMSWTLLQFVSFEREDYNTLLDALREWEKRYETDGEVASGALEITPRRSSPDTLNSGTNNSIQRSDQHRFLIEDLQTSTSSRQMRAEAEVSRTSEDVIRPANDITLLAPNAAITSSLQILPASVQSTIPSSTNQGDDDDAPEYLSQTEDGNWRIRTRKSLRDVVAPSREPPSSALQRAPATPIKRQHEDEVDFYGVSSLLQAQVPSTQANIAIPLSKTLQEIWARFPSSKRRKIGDGKAKHVD